MISAPLDRKNRVDLKCSLSVHFNEIQFTNKVLNIVFFEFDGANSQIKLSNGGFSIPYFFHCLILKETNTSKCLFFYWCLSRSTWKRKKLFYPCLSVPSLIQKSCNKPFIMITWFTWMVLFKCILPWKNNCLFCLWKENWLKYRFFLFIRLRIFYYLLIYHLFWFHETNQIKCYRMQGLIKLTFYE